MPPWHSISFAVESSGALSIVTREDVDPGHALECCYIISTDDRVSVRLRETHLGDGRVGTDRDSDRVLCRDVPSPALQEARRWPPRSHRSRAGQVAALRTALELHLRHLGGASPGPAVQPAVAVGRARRSLRSLSRPPLNASIVRPRAAPGTRQLQPRVGQNPAKR